MERRQPQYIECARTLMRDHFDAMPDRFSVRMLAPRMPEHKPAMITNALRHLEESGIVHAPGDKTYDGATGERRVAVLVWCKGASTGPRVVARKGGDSHVPPSVALKRLGLPSPHDKAAELQQCMANGVPLENIAEPAERPVYYVPRAWLDEHAPEMAAEPTPAAGPEPETVSPAGSPSREDEAMAVWRSIDARLATLITMLQRGQGRLPF